MTVTALGNIQPKRSPLTIRPMPLWQALFYFGLPALLFRLCLYNGIPVLTRLGLPQFEAWALSFIVPAAILFALAFVFSTLDGSPPTWNAIKTRFRLLPLTGKDWLWAIGGFFVTYLSIGALSFTAPLLLRAFPALHPPAFFPPWQQPGAALSTPICDYYPFAKWNSTVIDSGDGLGIGLMG